MREFSIMACRMSAKALAAYVAVQVWAAPAWAQRPPQQGGQNKDLSFEKAVDWVLARPGVMAAMAIILAVVVYYIIMNRRPKA
jgi:hypothetical protein